MENYKCFGCDHECRINTGSMFGSPVKCVVDTSDVKWVKIGKIMKPFSDQPKPGQKVTVFLLSGGETIATCCQVDAPGFSGLQWYDEKTGSAIDVNKIKGWWPYNKVDVIDTKPCECNYLGYYKRFKGYKFCPRCGGGLEIEVINRS